jgi:hypothetical protein
MGLHRPLQLHGRGRGGGTFFFPNTVLYGFLGFHFIILASFLRLHTRRFQPKPSIGAEHYKLLTLTTPRRKIDENNKTWGLFGAAR